MSNKPNSLVLIDGKAKFVRVKDRVPLQWTNLDALIEGIRKVVIENRGIKKILIEDGKPFIALEREVTEEEAASVHKEEVTFHDAIRAKPMEEYVPEDKLSSPYHQLYDMFSEVNRHGFEISCVLISGPTSKFYQWTKLPRRSNRVCGAVLELVPQIPDDVFIVCGAASRDASPEEVEFSLKGSVV